MSFSILLQWIRPTLDALFSPNLPWSLRWRLLGFQGISSITYSISLLPWAFSRRYSVTWIPIRSARSVRAIVFRPPTRATSDDRLPPLHLDVHGGAFLGGCPEQEGSFLAELCDRTGSVVVSTQYRCSPRHPFPAAINDVDDVVQYVLKHAEDKFSADPKLFTVSGFSSGGNLALATSLQEVCRPPSATDVKAALVFYGSIDLRLPPQEKAKPPDFPETDPLKWMMPLFDSYARLAPQGSQNDPRLHPCLAPLEHLPRNILLLVAGMDILVHEQEVFYKRLREELDERGDGERRVELILLEKQIHGFLELPKALVDQKQRERAFNASIDFIRDIHKQHGWEWSS